MAGLRWAAQRKRLDIQAAGCGRVVVIGRVERLQSQSQAELFGTCPQKDGVGNSDQRHRPLTLGDANTEIGADAGGFAGGQGERSGRHGQPENLAGIPGAGGVRSRTGVSLERKW